MEEQLVKYFSGNLSPDEERKIEEWRSESDENASEFLACHEVWKFSRPVDTNSAEALSAVMNRIDAIEGRNDRPLSLNFRPYLKYAAVLLLGFGLVFFGKDWVVDSAEQLSVEAKQNLEILTLPDGSVVTLSQNSTLAYDQKFIGDTRNVTLKGKAFFDIKRDESKPFVVHTEQSRIEVLGTSFLVNTESNNALTEVFVKTGRVAVTKNKAQQTKTIELVAGEVGRLVGDATVFEKSSIEDYNYLAWKTKLIEFDSQDLKTVLKTLQEVYGVDVKVSNDKILDCQMSAKFDNQPIESVLEILSRTFNLELKKSSSHEFFLSGEGCILVQ